MVPKTMKAAVAEGRGEPLIIRDVPTPEPGADQILVELEGCGVCHTDLHLRDGDEDISNYPYIFGHEGVGRIVSIGRNVSGNWKKGDRVGLPYLYATCLDCPQCLTGEETFCVTQHARGVFIAGAFAEFALLDSRFAVRIPDSLDPVKDAPLLCAGLTAWSALKKTRIGPGRNCLIVGCGGLGQYAISIAKAYGAKVIACDSDPTKFEIARLRGADDTVRAGEGAAQSIIDVGGADIVINFAPSAKVWDTIAGSVNPQSDVVAVGIVHDPVPLKMMWLVEGGHRVTGSSVGSRQELRDLLAFAAKHDLAIDVETIALKDVNAALNRLAAGKVKGRLAIDFRL